MTTKTVSDLYASLLGPQTTLSSLGVFGSSPGPAGALSALARPTNPLRPATALSALGISSPPNPVNARSALAMFSAPLPLGDALAGLGSASYRPPQFPPKVVTALGDGDWYMTAFLRFKLPNIPHQMWNCQWHAAIARMKTIY